MENQNHPKDQKKMAVLRFIWASLPLLFFFTLIIVLSVSISAKKAALEEEKKTALKKEEQKTNVVTMKVSPAPIQDRINLPGVTEPWVKLTILSEVNGKVLRKIKEEGAPVQEGELIAVLDARDYQNALISAQASYHLALTSKERMEKLYR